MIARLTAALLALRQGRSAEAEAHLARAEELSGDRSGLLFYGLDAVRAELALATGDTERAVAAAMAGVRARRPREPRRAADPAGREGLGGRGAGVPGPGRGPRAGGGATARPAESLSGRCRRNRARTDVQAAGPRDAGVVRRRGPAGPGQPGRRRRHGSAPRKPAPMASSPGTRHTPGGGPPRRWRRTARLATRPPRAAAGARAGRGPAGGAAADGDRGAGTEQPGYRWQRSMTAPQPRPQPCPASLPANARSSPTSWPAVPTRRSPASWCSARRPSACTSRTCCERPAPPTGSS